MSDTEIKEEDSSNKKRLASEAEAVKQLKEPKSWLMFTVLAPIAIFFVGGWLVVVAFFDSYADKLEKESIAEYGYEPDKLKQMEYETNALYSYGYDEEGKIRIPIDRAMEIVTRRYQARDNN